MKRIVLALSALSSADPILAKGLTSGMDYRHGCWAVAQADTWRDVPHEHEAAARACLGAIAVLLHGGKEQGICSQDRVAQDRAAAIVARYLDEHTEEVKHDFRSLAHSALSTEFPCDAEK